jgi:hypothetical protein
MRPTKALIWSSLFIFGALLPVFYFTRWMPVTPDGMDRSLFERGIGTPLLMVLNGYLGLFFNYRYIGDLAWIALPLIVVAMINWRRMERWMRGTVLCLVLCALIIGAQGGFNYRYAMTLLPCTLAVIFLVLHASLPRAGFGPREKRFFFVAMLVLSCANSALALAHRRWVGEAQIDAGRRRRPAGAICDHWMCPHRTSTAP